MALMFSAQNIIRKTKRSAKIKRSVLSRKTKRSFFSLPPLNVKKRPREI